MSDFGGTEYATSLAALSGMHIFNKKVTNDQNNKDSNNGN